MATVATQPMPDVTFGEEEGPISNTDITLFNVSPVSASPLIGAKGVPGLFSCGSPSAKYRRSQKLLLKRKKLDQLKTQQDGDKANRKISKHFPSTASGATMLRTPRAALGDGGRRGSRDDITDLRRQEFMERRRYLIQQQIKRRLAFPVNDSSRKPKEAVEKPPEVTIQVHTPTEKDRENINEDNQEVVSPDHTQAVSDVDQNENEPNPGQNLIVPVRPSLPQRRKSLIRTNSFAVRSANTITRKAVDIISDALEFKRERRRPSVKSPKPEEEEQRELGRKYSMMWMSKTVESKRMGYMRGADDVDSFTPFNKFRRAARLVKSLIQVCRVCQDIVLDSVSSEDWYKKIESLIDSTEILSKAQGPSKVRPFITFVQDSKSKELVQLTFDKSMFARERRADYLLTAEIRKYLRLPSYERTIDQENEVLMFMKRAVPEFNSYSLDAQRRIIQCMHYDKYERDRVITRQGLTADGVYFILSGTLIEKDEGKRNLREMKPGESFGEDDIICGCPRRNTVITRSEVELVSIHRLDYRAIVHMADDSSHPKYLDICKHDIVFQHFPMKKLIENPGVWTVLSYKYGRLIVKDSNEMEWIYIIKSGEAKVLKQLTVGKIDLNERRRNIKAKKNRSDPHAFQRRMITFVSEREYLKSHYKRGDYRPGTILSSSRQSSFRSTHSAPVSQRYHRQQKLMQSLPGTPHVQPMTDKSRSPRKEIAKFRSISTDEKDKPMIQKTNSKLASQVNAKQATEVLRVEFEKDIQCRNAEATENENESEPEELETDYLETPLTTSRSPEEDEPKPQRSSCVDDKEEIDSSARLKRHTSYIDTSSKGNLKLPPLEKTGSKASLVTDEKKTKMIAVPPFVQLESLHAGKVFGLRSCLHPEERGPSASLVSGGCEVLQVNKKFFMKHADEALIGLIRVQYKPYPTEDDLIDRLDNNFQWEEFKQTTVGDFLVRKGKMKEEELKNITIELAGS